MSGMLHILLTQISEHTISKIQTLLDHAERDTGCLRGKSHAPPSFGQPGRTKYP